MATLSLRNLDSDLLRWLRQRAADHGNSVNAELLDLIAVARADELAATARGPIARSLRRARERGIRTPSTSRAITRADRDRDDARRR